eukprot:snap_masked-scaffold_52-processed-gene-1.74-mRNA-1 protein AED:1.00 eAED:1.00 QI:0/0/0/0/1/1/2/0/65
MVVVAMYTPRITGVFRSCLCHFQEIHFQLALRIEKRYNGWLEQIYATAICRQSEEVSMALLLGQV